MLKRPKPKTLTPEAQAAINAASAAQTGKSVRVRSYDPDYPVFEVPVNQKILAYVPNHTMMAPDGSVCLRWDKFAAHPVLDGRSFADIRCSNTIVAAELGLDGTCPLCSAMDEVWELYNKEYADIARSKGIDPKSPEAQEALKEDRKTLASQMVIKNPDIWLTFPIVVIDCVEKDGKLTVTPKKDAEGRISGKPMWYSIRERTYLEKWGSAFDALEGDDESNVPTTAAGQWVILNFTYQPKSGKHDKMGSARNLTVSFKTMNGYEEWAAYFDNLTEGWDIAKAQETVVLDVVRDMDEMIQVRDTIMKPVHDKLAMYALGESSAVTAPSLPAGSAEQTLEGFGGVPVPEAPAAPSGQALTGEMPNVGIE